MSEERKPRVPTCRYHCSGCGRHFASEGAFDGHRKGDHAEGRYCDSPRDDERGRYDAELGVCNIYERQEGVPIFFLTRQREEARQRFQGDAA